MNDDSVAVVIGGRGGPTVREIALGDVQKAVVQVEFSKPSEASWNSRAVSRRGAQFLRMRDLTEDSGVDSVEDDEAELEDVENEEGFDK